MLSEPTFQMVCAFLFPSIFQFGIGSFQQLSDPGRGLAPLAIADYSRDCTVSHSTKPNCLPIRSSQMYRQPSIRSHIHVEYEIFFEFV